MDPAYRLTINGSILTRANLLLWMREFFRTANMSDGYVLEFGVLNGESLAEIWRCLRGPLTHLYGFDSFEGLPETDETRSSAKELMPMFHAGNYRSIGAEGVQTFLKGAGIPQQKLTLVPGFFDQSLPALSPTALVGDKNNCLVVHVDCDLYDSAVPVFKFVTPLVQTGTWLLLDDYWCFRGSPRFGVRKAFEEWLKTNGRWGATEYASYNGFGKAFILHEL